MTFEADLKRFEERTLKRLRKVFVDSVSDVLELAQTSAKGKTAGGTLIEGRIPVVSADLINSLASELDGALIAQGPGSYTVALAGLELGDIARFGWTVEYALRVENGFTGTDSLGRTFNQPGWHFVGVNVAKWPQIVAKNAALNP